MAVGAFTPSRILGFCLVIAGGGLSAHSGATEEIFVSNYTAGTVTVCSRTAIGDSVPIRTIKTGLDLPHTMAVDLVRGELFVANNRYADPPDPSHVPAIMVYDLGASFHGNDTPKRSIWGALTGLTKPTGLFVA